LVLSITFWVTAHPQYLRAQASGEQRSFARTFLRQYLPPAPPLNTALAGD
jgi:hypothetical protein